MSQLNSYQYDIFQRYFVLARALETAFPVRKKPVRVLDIGSGPASLTRTFLPAGFEITSADVDQFGQDSIVLIERGKPLPFEDDAFDAVVCMDVLEHIPPEQHELYVSELARLASKVLVVAFPHDAAAVKEGEKLLDRGYVQLFGNRCEFLVEHEEFGLPPHRQVAERLETLGCSTATIGIAPLAEWLLYSYLDIFALSLFGPGAEKDEINRRFNSSVSIGREPEGFYRAMIIASRSPRLVAQLEKTVLQHKENAEAPVGGVFELPMAAFDAGIAIAERLRKKSYQDVYAAVAQDLARLSAPATGAQGLATLQAGVEEAARALAEIRKSLDDHDQLGATNVQLTGALTAAREYREALDLERNAHKETQFELERIKDVQRHVVMETTALSEQVKSLSDTLSRQVQLHELKLNEMNALLEQRDTALDEATRAMADAQQQRDANAENVRSLAAALQRQIEVHETDVKTMSATIAREAHLHEGRIRELEEQVRELTTGLDAERRALAQARDEHRQLLADTERRLQEATLRRDGAVAAEVAMRQSMDELEAAITAERTASRRRIERMEFLVDSQKVELGRVSTRLRCEKRARLMDLQRTEASTRPRAR